jgi:hypothetical protein
MPPLQSNPATAASVTTAITDAKVNNKMTKVIRFFATGLLVVSLAAVALAEGGETHGTGLAPPQPPTMECTAGCSGDEEPCPVPDPVDASEVANMLVTWLVQSTL